uniref:NADH-ubiquinone oxidoreductase n=1 Tax=Globodera pallida TaxID=36090 RepID=A0A183C0M4_GLOPA
MTTGRINQVTIVCRGRPSAAPNPLWEVWLRGPKRRTQHAASTIPVSAARGYLPLLRHPQYAVTPERAVSWRSTTTMNPPLPRPEPAKLYRGTRSGSLQDLILRVHIPAISTKANPMVVVPSSCEVRGGRERRLKLATGRIDGFGEPTLDLVTYPTPPHSLLIPPWTAAQEPDQHMGGTVEVVSERYEHADTAPLNNFFTFTYPAARDGPRPGRITPSHMYTDDKSGEPIGEIEAKDGLPSADRNNKATLLLTGPFRTAKSSAKDLTPLVLKLQYAKYHDALRAPWKNRLLRR